MAYHQHRDDLTGEHRLGDAGQVALASLFGLVWLLDSSVFRYTTFLNEVVPVYVRIPLAIGLLALAAYLARGG